MPQVTVYIRQGDLDQWKAIEKKSEFIHDALIMAKLPPEVLKTRAAPTKVITLETPPKTVQDVINNTIREGEKMLRDTPKFPPSAASGVIKTPEQAKKIVDTPQFIDKKYSARKPGFKERHVDL